VRAPTAPFGRVLALRMQAECRRFIRRIARCAIMLQCSNFSLKGQYYSPILRLRRTFRDANPGRNAHLHDEELAMRLAAIHSLTDGRNSAGRSGFGHFASRLPGSRLLGRVGAWLKRRIVLAELHGLDDRTLADLRISRGDFQAIAEGTYIREGGAYDVARHS
jgi:uncharacterized protein YjiS (DUF1127 family)